MARRADAPFTTRGLWLTCLAVIAAVWVVGYGIRSWVIYQDTADYEAAYPDMKLQPGAQVAPQGDHVALWGNPLEDAILTFSQNSSTSYYLIPVVAQGWQTGQPVSVVVKSKTAQLRDPPYFDPTQRRVVNAESPVLARVAGQLAVPAAQEFERMGLTLAQPYYLLERVPSKAGKPLPPDTEQVQWFYLFMSGFISLLIALCFVVVHIKRRKELRVQNASMYDRRDPAM